MKEVESISDLLPPTLEFLAGPWTLRVPHYVRPGESLTSIASKYGVDGVKLYEDNKACFEPPMRVIEGTTLTVTIPAKDLKNYSFVYNSTMAIWERRAIENV